MLPERGDSPSDNSGTPWWLEHNGDQPTLDDLPAMPSQREDALEVYGIVYAQLERGEIDAAMNELREAARRLGAHES